MTEYERRQQTWIVRCPCDFEERFASEAGARAVKNDHDVQCPNTPEVHEADGSGPT